MKSYVITIEALPGSVESAKRCIESFKPDYDVEMFSAITPNHNPFYIAKEKNIPTEKFYEKYSRVENCLSAFLSHFSLWEQCAESNEEYQIFEHDAVCVNVLPKYLPYKGCISFGAPSYGKFVTPITLGVNSLTSKNYFPGAHAYRLKPNAAKVLVERAKIDACPTDVFLHKERFPWLEEFYPWAVVAKDTFTTIQRLDGCVSKHNYKGGYKIVKL